MDDRMQRYVIPATIVLMSAAITLWVAGYEFSFLFKEKTADILGVVIAIGVTNYGLGYFAHVLFLGLMFISLRERLVDVDRLFQAFHVVPAAGRRTNRRLQSAALLAVFHHRLHSNAGESFLAFCTRRNSAWYVSRTCGIAALLGFIVGTSILVRHPPVALSPWWSLWVLLVVAFYAVSGYVGNRWNQEFWDVAWIWIAEITNSEPLDDNFLEINGFQRQRNI